MILVYKFLFKKRCEKTSTRQKVDQFDDEKLLKHGDRYMRKVYDEHVATFRDRMFTLMLQEEPLVDDNSSLCTEIEETGREAGEASTSNMVTEFTGSNARLSVPPSLAQSMVNIEGW